jgi:hypothetical protein
MAPCLYLKPVRQGNHKLLEGYAYLNSKATHCPGGVYYLRYSTGGKLVWRLIGTDAPR